MQITFTNTPDDIRAFAGYMYSRSKTLRRSRLKSLALVAGAMIIIYVAAYGDNGWIAAIVWTGFAIALIIALDIYTRHSYIRNAVRKYRQREGNRESRASTLTITERGIAAVSQQARAEFNWKGIDRIDELEDRTYIFVSPLDAIIIRRDAVTDGDYRAFIDAVKKHVSDLSVRVNTKG